MIPNDVYYPYSLYRIHSIAPLKTIQSKLIHNYHLPASLAKGASQLSLKQNYSGGASSSSALSYYSTFYSTGFQIYILAAGCTSPKYVSPSPACESRRKLIPIFLPGSTGVYLPPTKVIYCLCFYAILAGLLKTEELSSSFFYIHKNVPQAASIPVLAYFFPQLARGYPQR